MKKLGLPLISLFAAFTLAACGGGGGDSPPQAASADLTAAVNSSSVAAIAGEQFTFANGVTDFGTTSSTAVTLTDSTFDIAATEGTASGDLTFGSCIFTVTASTFTAPSLLDVGDVVTVQPCSITVATAGQTATNNAIERAVSFLLGGNASAAKNLEVQISPTGTVTVEGVSIGTVTMEPVTGGS